MAEKLKRAAAWLGLVADDRYADYDDRYTGEQTEGISREELLGAGERTGTVTALPTKRTVAPAATVSGHPSNGAAPAGPVAGHPAGPATPSPSPRTAGATWRNCCRACARPATG